MSNQQDNSQKNYLKAALGVIAILLLFIASDFAAKHLATQRANEPFQPKEGVHFVKIDKTPEISDLLLSLGVGEADTFEIMSYTCPACRSIEPVLEYVERVKNIDIHKFQLGNDSIPMAEAEYYVSQISPANLTVFRDRMFTKMTSHADLKEKVSFAKNVPFEFGITPKQMNEMDVYAKQYAKDTTKLADLLKVTKTPTLYVKGQYMIVHEAHENFDQYSQTLEYILDNK
jgi:thiol-disulfide isomerase/thioredoxin